MNSCIFTPQRPSSNLKYCIKPNNACKSSNMAFLPRHFYNSDASFTPLFRFLDDFDSYSRQTARNIPTWQPKFDVRETEQGYELHGEFPGVNKDDVHIEFTEPQTMLIRGKTERTYTSGTPPAAAVEDAQASGAITEGTEKTEKTEKDPYKDSDKASVSSHQATVEDEYESISHEIEEPQHADPEDVVPEVEQPVTAPEKQPVADTAKYWLTERSVGSFSRTFHFPTRVEQESVTASFKDGILSVLVPKAKKHESRRIAVF